MNLRPYQIEAVERIRDAIRRGHKNILLCAPTGAGKTIIGAHLIEESYKKSRRAAFVCDRVNLIDQTSAVFDGAGIPHGVMQGSHWRAKPWERVQICSAQTIARRNWPITDLILIDEAHTVHTTVKNKLEKQETISIGLTATPFSKGLGKLYTALVNVTTTNKLIADGFLSNYRIFAPSQPNMDGVKVVAGEWDEKETSDRAMKVVGDCVAEYVKLADGKKFICAAVDTAHVEELHRQFMAAGIMCAQYTYKVTDTERADIVTEFRKPDSYIRGLITVTAASKGFDVPDIECVIMARPLRKSLAEHIQFFGRGLRAYAGKEECLVLDHSGNCERFWTEWNDFFEKGALELDDGRRQEKKAKNKDDEEASLTKCSNCKHLHKAMPYCPACGHEYPVRSKVQHEAGTLSEIVATGDRALQTKKIWPQIVALATAQKSGAIAEKYALALYKKITGEWPTTSFHATEPQEVTTEIRNKVKSLNIAFARQRAKGKARA